MFASLMFLWTQLERWRTQFLLFGGGVFSGLRRQIKGKGKRLVGMSSEGREGPQALDTPWGYPFSWPPFREFETNMIRVPLQGDMTVVLFSEMGLQDQAEQFEFARGCLTLQGKPFLRRPVKTERGCALFIGTSVVFLAVSIFALNRRNGYQLKKDSPMRVSSTWRSSLGWLLNGFSHDPEGVSNLGVKRQMKGSSPKCHVGSIFFEGTIWVVNFERKVCLFLIPFLGP